MRAASSRHAGYALYNGINFVVFLTENMRAKHDQVYTRILSELRWGRITDVDLATLNTRAFQQDRPTVRDMPDSTSFYRPVVVATNNLRCAINRTMTLQVAKRLGRPIYESTAVASNRSRAILRRILNVNDELTDRIPIKLLFFIGMPVMVTRKHPKLLQADVIANGVLGTIVGICPPVDELQFDAIEVDGATIRQFQLQPQLILVKIRGITKELVRGFPPGVIGIPPLHAPIRLNKLPNLSQASITVDQFALVPAFACTTEKLQGQTCHDGIVVTPLDQRKAVPRQSLYVALSRCVSLEKLTLTSRLTRDYLKYFYPSQDVANEMQRLIDEIVLPPYILPPLKREFDEWRDRQKP